MKRLLTLVFFSLLLTSLYAERAWTDEMICNNIPGADYRDFSQYEPITSSYNDADIYQWKHNRDIFLYAPKGYDYKLIVILHEGIDLGERWEFAARGWGILGVMGKGDCISIPAELEIGANNLFVNYIEEGALSDIATIEATIPKVIFEERKSNEVEETERYTLINNKGTETEFVINREMSFMEPVSDFVMKHISFGKNLTIYPHGLYCATSEELTIPSQFKALPGCCFYGCPKPSIINLPESLEKIGAYCFANSGLSSLRIPFYLRQAGECIIKGSNVSKVYMTWQPSDQHLICNAVFGFLRRFGGAKNKTTYYIPRNAKIDEGAYAFGNGSYYDKELFIWGRDEDIINQISYCDYIYHWVGDSLSEIVVPNGIFAVAPELKDNELLVVTPDAGVTQGPNVIAGDRDGNYHASHLRVTDSNIDASATKFVLPYDTYCDTLSFVTDQTGYKALKLPIPGVSDLSNWVGHRYNNEYSTYIPADTIDAGKFVLALRTSTGTQSTYLIKSAKGTGKLIKATDKIIEICDADSRFPKYVVGYQHPTGISVPQFSETGDYNISSLGELYFFQHYAPYTQGKVTLMKDLYLPQGDLWAPIPSFSKTFDGNGHVIKGMTVIPFDKSNGGMFAQLNEGSVVKRLYLKGTVQGYEGESYNYVGGLVGLCNGSVNHCVIDMDINIDHCTASAIVIGKLPKAKNAPTYNVMMGRVVSSSTSTEEESDTDVHGLLIGRFGIAPDVTDEAARTEASTYNKAIQTNLAASSAYCKIGTNPANQYFCDPRNISKLSDHLYKNYTYYLIKHNLVNITEIQNGWISLWKKDYLVQNVSSMLAPLDSVPYPAANQSNKPKINLTLDKNLRVPFPYHNCINYSGGSTCSACKRSNAASPTVIKIGTAEELRAFAKEVNASTTPQHWLACLTADIDLEDEEWTPIGDNPDLKYDDFCEPDIHCDTLAFRGIFNGQGHTIRGLKVSGSDRNNRGLFGVLHDNALVCNLVIYGNVEGNVNVGSVAGLMSRSEVSSVISYVNVQGEKNTGGLVGAMVGNHAYLANSIYLGKVTAEMADDKANGRLVGAANTRFLKSWDIQSVKIKNVYAPLPPEDKDDLFEIGSGSVPNAYICTLDSIYFRNDSVNHAIKNEFYQNLLSALYHITGIDKQPTCEVEIEPVIPDTPDTPVTPGTDETDEPDEPPFVDECYEISNGKQLRCFANMVNSDDQQTYKAKLIKDIDLKDEEWTPIGSGTKYFKGTFDGQGHIIRGLCISKSIPNVNYYGLFGTLNQGTVQNVMVYGKGIETGQNAGVIAGKATSSHVKNCLVDCPVTGTGTFDVGGIIGTMDKNTDVANCLVLSSVQNTSNANLCGQIVGYAINCCVRNCLASGDGSVLGINAKRRVTTNGCETNLYDSIACGAVAYRLAHNADTEDNATWGQTFGTDTVPILGGKDVYCGGSDVDYDYCNVDTIQTSSDDGTWQLHIVAHRLNLSDSTDLRLPNEVTSLKAVEIYHYRRDSRGFNSICLPGYLPTEALPEGYVLGYMSYAMTRDNMAVITFTTTQLLKEHQPGIFFMADESKRRDKQDAEILLNAYRHNLGALYEIALEDYAHTAEFNGITLHGAYKKKKIGNGYYKISNDGGELLHTTENSNVYPYHWYLSVPGTRATRAIIGITPQAPENEGENEGETIYFDLSGRRINPDTHQGIRLSRDAKSVINK